MKTMKKVLLGATLALLAGSAMANGPLVPIGQGPIYIDSSGNLYFCFVGGTNCVPLTGSEEPIEP
jgi:hypothetical protein